MRSETNEREREERIVPLLIISLRCFMLRYMAVRNETWHKKRRIAVNDQRNDSFSEDIMSTLAVLLHFFIAIFSFSSFHFRFCCRLKRLSAMPPFTLNFPYEIPLEHAHTRIESDPSGASQRKQVARNELLLSKGEPFYEQYFSFSHPIYSCLFGFIFISLLLRLHSLLSHPLFILSAIYYSGLWVPAESEGELKRYKIAKSVIWKQTFTISCFSDFKTGASNAWC